MTDYRNTRPIRLTDAEYVNIQVLGKAALAAISAAQTAGQTPPVGVWSAMYNYIFGLIEPGPSGAAALQAPAAQQYWYQQAQYITGDKENVPSGYFVRDVTAIGMNVSGPSSPAIQAVSNQIGTAIYDGIFNSGFLPAFWAQLTDDIYSALGGSKAGQYPYLSLPIGSWGGTFYYWNAPFDPNANPNGSPPATPPQNPLSQYILGNSSQNQTFITNYSQAIANTVIHFQSAIPVTSELISSFLSGLTGIKNIYYSGWQGKVDIVDLIQQTLIDYAAEGGATSPLQSALLNFVSSTVGLYLGSGSTSISAGGDGNVLVGGQGAGSAGNDTLIGGGNNGTFLVNLPATGSVSETIADATGLGNIVISNAGQFTTLGGSVTNPLTAVAGQMNTWQDSAGTQYVFNAATSQLVISQGALGSGNQVVINNFNIATATGTNPFAGSATGFAGIFLPEILNLTAGANAGVDPPAPNFQAGSTQSYTLSVDAPSTTARTLTVSLSGVNPADFTATVGNQSVQQNSDGTFSFLLPAGETNVSFSLANSADVGGAANLQLSAALSNPNAATITTNTLTQTFVEPADDPFKSPQPMTYYGGGPPSGYPISYTEYSDYGTGPGVSGPTSGNNYIYGAGPIPNYNFSGTNSVSIDGGTGNDTIEAYFGGSMQPNDAGVNVINGHGGQDNIIASPTGVLELATIEIYANTQVNLQTAIANANLSTATHQQGDLISEAASSSTIVGGTGNDLLVDDNYTAGVIVAGSGDDTILGGVSLVRHLPYGGGFVGETWSTSFTNNQLSIGGDLIYYTTGIFEFLSGQGAPAPAGYEGNYDAYGSPLGGGNDTIFGGAGKDVIILSNGNNQVTLGLGDSTVLGGMGENTIIGGGGNSIILGGGGSDYIADGSGSTFIVGRAGNNTIIGGSGADTLVAGASGSNWATGETGNDYVDGGSGNALIYGSGGSDTLIGGIGNSTLLGGAGAENIAGGSGNDLLIGGSGNDTLAAGGSGRDSLYAGGSSSSTSILYGGGGQDYIVGASGTNTLYAGDGGTTGAATSVFASQSDATATTTIYGGLGVDYLEAGAGATVIMPAMGEPAERQRRLLGERGPIPCTGGWERTSSKGAAARMFSTPATAEPPPLQRQWSVAAAYRPCMGVPGRAY
jgi:Ca2+-binding RTX toxin-like protein